MHHILTWDLEIRHPVEDVGGWPAVYAGEAGVSCLCIRDNLTGRTHYYDDHNLGAAVDHLNSADLAVGFNSISFDTPVTEAVSGRLIAVPQYDILAEVWAALPSRCKGYKLDEIAQRTLGEGKNGHGEYATALVAQGRWADLFDYCTNDVALTARLFNHIVEHGFVVDIDGNELYLEKPATMELA